MTDKQKKQEIIIDCVDVSGCMHYFNKGCLNSGKALGVFCLNNPYCYYKQLQREKKLHQEANEQAFKDEKELYNLNIEFQRKTEECKALKEQNETFHKMLNSPEVKVALTDVRTGEREVQAKIRRRLEKENVNYKQALAPFEDEYFKGLDTKQIAELAKKSIRLTTENRKLEATLDEIKEYADAIQTHMINLNNALIPSYNKVSSYNAFDCSEKILDIISKAKGVKS